MGGGEGGGRIRLLLPVRAASAPLDATSKPATTKIEKMGCIDERSIGTAYGCYSADQFHHSFSLMITTSSRMMNLPIALRQCPPQNLGWMGKMLPSSCTTLNFFQMWGVPIISGEQRNLAAPLEQTSSLARCA